VYPSAYANAYASKICAGKIKDPSGLKRKDFRGRKPSAMGGRVYKAGGGVAEAAERLRRQGKKNGGMMEKGFTKDQVKKIKDLEDMVKNKRVSMEKSMQRVSKEPKTPTERDLFLKELRKMPKKFTGFEKDSDREKRRLRNKILESRQGLKRGGVAKGCGAIMSNRRKITKVF
jgi:hypothetical protein